MASGHRIRKVQRKVLQAAALGSVKRLRNLLHSSARPSRKEKRKSQKRERYEDHNIEFEGQHKKRSRRGPKREQGEEREIHRKRIDRKRKEAVERATSGEKNEDFDTREDEIRQWKRSRREQQRETNRNASAERGQATDDHSSSSPGTPPNHGSCTESDVEADERRSGRKHISTGETVKSMVNCRDAQGSTPLHHACLAGSDELVKYLISKGASVHARDSKGDTPLHIAARLGASALISILKNADADMEAFNDQGVTPSDMLSKKEAANERATTFKDQQKWNTHLVEELSEDENMWWGSDWGDESEQQDWDVPILEKMAESRQGRGVYNQPFNLRDFLKTEKGNTQGERPRKPKRKGRSTSRPSKDEERKSPEVIGPKVKVLLETRSYIQRWKAFSESYNLCLSYSSVPFPVEEGKEDTLGEVLLQGIDASMHRAVLRKEMLRWHPDKFLQKWGAKFQGPDHDRIVARVNGISGTIHHLYKTIVK